MSRNRFIPVCFVALLAALGVACSASPATATNTPEPSATTTPTMTATMPPTRTPTVIPTRAPTATAGLGSMGYPYPLKAAASLVISNPGEIDFTVAVQQAARGPAVDAYAARAYSGVRLDPGMQFIFAQVDVNITSVESGSSYLFDSTSFQTMSDGQLSPRQFMPYLCFECNPYPPLSANFVAPGHVTGWVMLWVYIDDPHPLMVMGPFYFALE